jgi:2-succinyl-5-enolpyruvyl-6-hydroxy-3-cyclohexene-1-carboxylate synthase
LETTNKKSVQQLIEILWQKGVKHIVISPGSRNAPLILGFTSHSKYECLSVPDERSAGFIALGIADETNAPVALVCSSGSALLNYYPAIAEAFYRKIPLVILSADRPEYLIDQGDGQTIRQQNVFANHILYSSQVDEGNLSLNNETIINESLNIAITSSGPIHLNLPFEEPLYNKCEFTEGLAKIKNPKLISQVIPSTDLKEYSEIFNNSDKTMILAGQMDKNPALMTSLKKLSQAALILSETTTNQNIDRTIKSIDQLISPLNSSELKQLQPHLLITIGGNVVSKRIKAFLRQYKPQNHIHIEEIEIPPNTYQCLTHHCNKSAKSFFEQLLPLVNLNQKSWVQHWLSEDNNRKVQHSKFEDTVTYSDFKVMSTVNKLIPENSILHLANSTPVRYAQLFSWKKSLIFKSNRGTSGIDGIVSTAMGNAIATEKEVFLVIGDISFFYDTNAWWHRQIPNNLKVIVINNSGGGIFRFIDGPNSTGQLENHFETNQKNSVEHIALGFSVNYFRATNLKELEQQFTVLSNSKSSGILEVTTPQTENAGVLREYFNNLKHN